MVQIHIRSFGKIAEIIGRSDMTWQFDGNSEALQQSLKETYPELEKIHFSMAINKSITAGSVAIHEGDEIALLPPFSGG